MCVCVCVVLPAVDAPQCLFKPPQDFGWRGPLDVPPVVLHGRHVLEAPVHFPDVGLDLVAAVGPEDDEGGSHAPVTHPGDGATPHLGNHTTGETRCMVTWSAWNTVTWSTWNMV